SGWRSPADSFSGYRCEPGKLARRPHVLTAFGSFRSADAVIECVTDVKRPVGADRNAVRAIELRLCRWAAIAGASGLAAPGDRRDCAGPGVDAANRVVF